MELSPVVVDNVPWSAADFFCVLVSRGTCGSSAALASVNAAVDTANARAAAAPIAPNLQESVINPPWVYGAETLPSCDRDAKEFEGFRSLIRGREVLGGLASPT